MDEHADLVGDLDFEAAIYGGGLSSFTPIVVVI